MIDTRYVLIIAALIFGVLILIFDSIIWILVIISLYGASAFWGVWILEYAGIKIRLDRDECEDAQKSKEDGACRVCSGSACNRHRPSVHNAHVKVPKDFDLALQNLLETVLQTYVCEWYSTFSSDEAFLQELRLTIATAARNIIGRLFRANISEVIFNNLLPVALQHAEDWRILCVHAEKNGNKPEDNVLEYLGRRIHPAALSRDAEINYLRGLVTGFIPHLIPSSYISTNNKVILREILANWVLLPAMDALSDPDTINFLVELCTQYEGNLSEELDAVDVPALQTWITPRITVQGTEDPLKPSLEQILDNPELLYLFMQHIKEAGPVNLLQFCLDIDDLSKRMLNPDVTPELEESLYTDAQTIYSTYLNSEGPEYLHLPWHISQGMHEILEGGPSRIQELRTSRPLYEAHHEAHARLEAICLPSFHHSFELYKLLCGSPVSSTFTRAPSQNSMTGGIGVGTRLSNQLGKIRGVLRASAVDGAPFQPPDVFHADEVDCSPRTYNDPLYEDKCCRDLSTWRVTVPHVDGGGAYPLYMIAVHSVAEDKSWTVLRRDQDFYVLRARLMEFHGDREMNDSPLPTRKNQTASLTANRQRYQDFLQKLLAKPTLRSSELLHIFLTAPNLKSYLTNYSTPDIGILYQNVAHKLRKEKGQHLDKFMNTFLASTCVKYEHADLGIEPITDHHFMEGKHRGKDLKCTKFGNNLDLSEMKESLPYVTMGKNQVKGACFCIAEAVETLLEVNPLVSKFTWLIASISRSSLDSICNKFMDRTLTKLLSGGRAAIVVKLLHTAMFEPKTSTNVNSSDERADERYKSAREGLHSLLPWWCFGLRTNHWCKLMDSLLEPLQSAPLNKHLAYVLVDQVLATLFPEESG